MKIFIFMYSLFIGEFASEVVWRDRKQIDIEKKREKERDRERVRTG